MAGAMPLSKVGVSIAALAGTALSPRVTAVLIRLAILAATVGPPLPRLFVTHLGVPTRLMFYPDFLSFCSGPPWLAPPRQGCHDSLWPVASPSSGLEVGSLA